jgi:hypothetical protein
VVAVDNVPSPALGNGNGGDAAGAGAKALASLAAAVGGLEARVQRLEQRDRR